MKKLFSILGLGAIAIMGLGSCSDEELPQGEGRLLLAASVNTDVKVAASRAASDTETLAEQCEVWISSSKGLVRRYQGLDNMPADGITLLSGHYVAEAWTGDSVSASFDARWFKGREEFDITFGQTTRVMLQCKIANVVATVGYDATVDDVLSDYTLTVSHDRGALVFEGRDDRQGYFMMPSTDKNLTWTLRGTLKSTGEIYTRTGVIEDVQPGYRYNISVKCSPNVEEFGGAYFTVEVDESAVVVEDNIVITIAPTIEGYGFNLANTLYAEAGKVERRSVFVKSGTLLSNLVLESADFATLLGFGEGGTDVDLLTMLPTVAEAVKNGGITWTRVPCDEADTEMIKISFEEEYLNLLGEGVHTVGFKATDKNGKTTSATMTINISDDAVKTEAPAAAAVWTREATLTGTVAKDGVQNVAFNYRKVGAAASSRRRAEGEWITAPMAGPFTKGQVLELKVEDLEPATTYEYTITADDFTTEAIRFTTGAAPQLPNASFESWNTSSTPYLLYGVGEEMFWDSGNHGSATLKKNVTVPNTTMVHSGERSIELASQKVALFGIGKFAAGNVFIGEYLATNGTNGVLGWGRPFTARPRQLKVWAHYTSTTVTESDDTNLYPKNVPDTGIIYVALMDSHTDKEYPAYPVVVKTETKQLFDANGEHVIAYGVHEFTESTPGSSLVEITIDIDYHRTDMIPSFIVLTASASKGGDYFAGGEGSTLILDDFELVY